MEQSEMDGKKELLMQMCTTYLGLQTQHQMERMQKMIESIDEESINKCYEVIRLDLIAANKRQIAQLNQQIKIMS